LSTAFSVRQLLVIICKVGLEGARIRGQGSEKDGGLRFVVSPVPKSEEPGAPSAWLETGATRRSLIMEKPMSKVFQQYRFTCVSLLCLMVSWMLLMSLLRSGMNSYVDTWWLNTWVFLSIFGFPTAAIIAIGGIVFERRKTPAVMALLLSLLNTLIVLLSGG
jgi:hypothetical protein